MPVSTTRLDERVLAVLNATADADGYVECTGRALAPHLDVSVATASRALLRLERAGALKVLIRGDRTGPSRYRVLREPNREVLRETPSVPSVA